MFVRERFVYVHVHVCTNAYACVFVCAFGRMLVCLCALWKAFCDRVQTKCCGDMATKCEH